MSLNSKTTHGFGTAREIIKNKIYIKVSHALHICLVLGIWIWIYSHQNMTLWNFSKSLSKTSHEGEIIIIFALDLSFCHSKLFWCWKLVIRCVWPILLMWVWIKNKCFECPDSQVLGVILGKCFLKKGVLLSLLSVSQVIIKCIVYLRDFYVCVSYTRLQSFLWLSSLLFL